MQKKKTKGTADKIDKHVGKNIREIRVTKGLSQEKVAEYLEITFQQVQKYERGSNRVSASRLLRLAQLFNVKIDAFYKGIEELPEMESALSEAQATAVRMTIGMGAELVPAIKLALQTVKNASTAKAA